MDINEFLAQWETYQEHGGDADVLTFAQTVSSHAKTALGLNQWVSSDKPRMEDFNEDNRIVDTKLRELFSYLNKPEQHRMIFRGKNLGSTFTEEQRTHVADGTFQDLFLGDYWVIGGVNWRIVDFDYWYNTGDTNFTKHHLVIMPDTALYSAQMNDSNTTTGGYVGSKMYTANLAKAKTMAANAFGNAVLKHRELLINAVANGCPSKGAWCDSTLELPNEPMIHGSHFFTPGPTGTVTPYRYTIDKVQLALFAVAPRFISIRANYWLRDVVTAAGFAVVGDYGYTDCNYVATGALGVRPVFPIGS